MSRFEEGCVFLLGTAFLLALFASTIQATVTTENGSNDDAIDKPENAINDPDGLPQDGTDSENEIKLEEDELKTVLLNPEQFKNKYKILKKAMKKNSFLGWLRIRVDRDKIFQKSYKLIQNSTPEELHYRWTLVKFSGDDTMELGESTREWYSSLSQEIFSPSRGLFKYVDENNDNYALQINPRSGENNDDHIEHFKFVGKVMGLAIFHGKRLNAPLIGPFYKMILDKKVEIEDVKNVDPKFYKFLVSTKENPEAQPLNFNTREVTSYGTPIRELKPGGDSISVTKNNVDEYINLLIDCTYVSSVKEQMSAFIKGLNHIVPLNWLMDFDEHELEFLIYGPREIDVAEWKEHTAYGGEYKKNWNIIEWFWEIINEFNNNQRREILRFVTNSDTLPIGGFQRWKISFTIKIRKALNEKPRADTDIRTLILSPYNTKDDLKSDLINITKLPSRL